MAYCDQCVARDLKIAAMQESIDGCAQKVAELSRRLAEGAQERETLKADLSIAQDAAGQWRDRLAQVLVERDTFRAEVERLRAELSDLKTGKVYNVMHDELVKSRAERDALKSLKSLVVTALQRTRDYLGQRGLSVEAVISEGLWDRGRRSALKESLNSVNAEFAEVDAALVAPDTDGKTYQALKSLKEHPEVRTSKG